MVSSTATALAALPRGAPEFRLNAVCPYYTMYPLSFPLRELAQAAPGEAVLDPFCGRGTTLYAARLCGLAAVGVDLNPVAVAVARAKLASTSVGRVMKLAENLVRAFFDTEPPEGQFWSLAFHPHTLRAACALRAGLLQAGDGHTASLLRAVFLGALHGPRNKGVPSYLSNQMPRSYATKPGPAIHYWEKHGLAPAPVDLFGVLRRRTRHVLESRLPPATGTVQLGDARTALRGLRRRFTRVITSPPYVGMRTYLPDQWLRHWALGGEATPAYSLPKQIGSQDSETFSGDLADVWTEVAARCERGTRMTIRFGALPSIPVEPSDLIEDSFRRSGARWRLIEERPAGVPPDGARQADQFARVRSSPIVEIDVVAILDE